MTRRRCCCEPTNCPDSNCESVRSQCQTLGLLPFTVEFGGVFQAVRCENTVYTPLDCELECDQSSIPCGGCSPCDPLGTAPGANGRTCPCKSQSCMTPRSRTVPDISLKSGVIADFCDTPHNSFWYMTSCTANEPCEVEATACCPWLGSVSCAFALVERPAGATRQTPGPLVGSWVGVPQPTDCQGDAVPFPLYFNSPYWGWPVDCTSVPPPPCSCACTCTGGWEPVVLQDTVGESFDCTTNPKVLYAQIVWVMPCGGVGSNGGLLCGDGCGDNCAASYIAVRYYGTSYDHNPYVPSNDWGPGVQCSDIACESTLNCSPSCCSKDVNVTIIYRAIRDRAAMAGTNKCQMQRGEYAPIGVGPCGPIPESLDSSSNVCTPFTAPCAPQGPLLQAMATLGILSTWLKIS